MNLHSIMDSLLYMFNLEKPLILHSLGKYHLAVKENLWCQRENNLPLKSCHTLCNPDWLCNICRLTLLWKRLHHSLTTTLLTVWEMFSSIIHKYSGSFSFAKVVTTRVSKTLVCLLWVKCKNVSPFIDVQK